MTEDEARGKWCPMVRVPDEGGASVNRHGSGSGDEVRCIASHCMMWVEQVKECPACKMEAMISRPPGTERKPPPCACKDTGTVGTSGHCGLAGASQPWHIVKV